MRFYKRSHWFPLSHVSPRVLTLLQYCVLWDLGPGTLTRVTRKWREDSDTKKNRHMDRKSWVRWVVCSLEPHLFSLDPQHRERGSQEAVSKRKLQLLDFVHSGHSVALGPPREKFCHPVEPGLYRNQLCLIHHGPKALIFICHGTVGVNNTHLFRPSSAPYMLAYYGCHCKSYSAHHQFVVC